MLKVKRRVEMSTKPVHLDSNIHIQTITKNELELKNYLQLIFNVFVHLLKINPELIKYKN